MMIKHIVMWKLKEFAEGRNRKDNSLIIKERLEQLKETIKEIKVIEVGINVTSGPGAYDLVLYSEFDNFVDLSVYQAHPEHVKISEFIGKVREERVVADYEVR